MVYFPHFGILCEEKSGNTELYLNSLIVRLPMIDCQHFVKQTDLPCGDSRLGKKNRELSEC
jgi:hypothetical protein